MRTASPRGLPLHLPQPLPPRPSPTCACQQNVIRLCPLVGARGLFPPASRHSRELAGAMLTDSSEGRRGHVPGTKS